MAYFAPYIDESGYHMPTYADIRDQLIANAQTIFGADIYLGIDSQDYQWISTVSSMIYDSFLAAQAVYNSRGPSTAVGSGLDGIVKINGIKRKKAVYSTCLVALAGAPNTMITNGVVGDSSGNEWSLSSPVFLDATGSATALATCKTPGPITAYPGDISKIVTPTLGWTSVTNSNAATIGANAETDAQLRSRQTISTAQPSRTVLEGIEGAIAAVSGVARFKVYENDTDAVDADGLPPHSITAVVENGTDVDIAQAIFVKKAPGAYTNGDIVVSVADQRGVASLIRFFRPTYVDIDVTVNVRQLAGYTSQATDDIKADVAAYVNSLVIGDDLTVSSLWGAALTANPVPNKPLFAITGLTAARHGDTQGTADIVIAFNEVARGDTANIVVNVT